MSFIFGEGTDLTYEDVQRKRKIADSLMAATMRGRSKNVGEGLSAIGRALMYRAMDKKATAGRDRLDSEASDLWGSVFGGGDTAGYGGSAMPSAAPSPQTSLDGYALDMGSTAAPDRNTVAVGGTEYDMGTPDYWGDKRDVQQGIFAGESGGDYDALFGYQNRPGGVFDGMKPSEMQVADILEFTNPRGAYGQYVKGQVGRVATPVGAYQIVGTTLRDAVKAGVVAPDERFSKDVQDRVGRWVLDTQGTGAWEGYQGKRSPSPSGSQPGMDELMRLASNRTIMSDPAKASVVQALLGQAVTPRDRNTQFVKGVGLIDLNTGEVVNDFGGVSGAPGQTEFGLNPQYGVDENGNPVLIQIGKDGTATQTQMPDGVTFQKEPIRVDAGTHVVLLDPITRQPIGKIEKNVAGAASEQAKGSAEGRATAEREQAAPGIIAEAENTISLINSVINDPSLAGITGKYEGGLEPDTLLGRTLLNQEETDLISKVEQIQGKAFLQAFESLKGGGQITEREGQAARAAIARLKRVQSPEAFQESLRELRQIAENGMRRAGGETVAEYSRTETDIYSDFDAFSANSEVQRAAKSAGVTVQDMWDTLQESRK